MRKPRHAEADPGRKTRAASKDRPGALKVLNRLIKEYPEATTELHHETPFELLIATILSAQCTDERVNLVTPGLFKRYPTPQSFAHAIPEELEQQVRSTGFFRMKTKSIIACSKALVERHDGVVPRDIEALVQLPGVGRKTANVVLGQSFGIASGVVVDTHVHRLAQRLGFSKAENAVKIEQDLMSLFPQKHWIDVGNVLILHGRRICGARNPKCPACSVADLCPSAERFLKKPR